jgi:hypothetical protein
LIDDAADVFAEEFHQKHLVKLLSKRGPIELDEGVLHVIGLEELRRLNGRDAQHHVLAVEEVGFVQLLELRHLLRGSFLFRGERGSELFLR